MRKFVYKTIVFNAINFSILLILLFYAHYKDINLIATTGETESVLISMPINTNADILIMGSSHGRMFSRNFLHDSLEQILSVKAVNISKTASGIIPQKLYLQYFYEKNNYAKKVVFFLDPFAFYSPDWNENLYFLIDEPFRFDFAKIIALSNINPDVKANYIKFKYNYLWYRQKANTVPDILGKLDSVDAKAVDLQLNAWFRHGYNNSYLEKYFSELLEIITIFENNNVNQIYLIIPPSLMGHFKGIDELSNLVKTIDNNKIHFLNHNCIYNNPTYFYDHSHLNNKGAIKYIKEVLINITSNCALKQ